jgi:hypothetical protein
MIRPPGRDGAPRQFQTAQQGAPGERPELETRPLDNRGVDIAGGDACQSRPQQHHGLLDDDNLGAIGCRLELDDLRTGGTDTRPPQRGKKRSPIPPRPRAAENDPGRAET